MNEREYLRLKQKFADEYEEKLRALDLIWQEMSAGKKPPREQQASTPSPTERGNAAAAVEEFVSQWNGDQFSAKQVEAWITDVKGQAASRTTIIHKLRRMLNEGHIDLVSKGSGKRGSLYIISAKTAPTPQIDMASEDDIQELRECLAERDTTATDFRAFLVKYYGVEKAKDLTKERIRGLIQNYNRHPVIKTEPEPEVTEYSPSMDMPDDEIPF